MSQFDPWYDARDEMVRALERDLMGTTQDNYLEEPPLDRFIVGILHPPTEEPIEDVVEVPDVETGTQVDAEYDPGVNTSRIRRPSSMGLTFAVDPRRTPLISVTVCADRYVPEVDGPLADDAVVGTTVADLDDEGQPVERFRTRKPARWNLVPGEPLERTFETTRQRPEPITVADGLELRAVVRPPVDGIASITVVLINTFPCDDIGASDEYCWFRPSIAVDALEGAFSDRRGHMAAAFGTDEASSELLYRDAVNVAAGHGCAVVWDAIPARRLTTTFVPRQEVLVARAERAELAGAFGMATLGRTDDRTALVALVDGYEAWIADQERQVVSLHADVLATAQAHLAAAREAAARIRKGIAVLDGDTHAAAAFRVMNLVMQEQRARQDMIRTGAKSPSPDEEQWRPFQLAFILLNVEGLADRSSNERDIADLLWFPTGGGKTEAYLGLIAFTLVLRRLRGAQGAGGGVGVIMRYTLRLLTLQQFERASGLICALESWRSAHLPESAPFSIGLWVGQSATPNDTGKAASALKALAMGLPVGEYGNPRQLLRCPWCGHDLPVSAYSVERNRLVVRCPSSSCAFRDGLPIVVVDSDVYEQRPSLVIGTVDKFAMMAWKAETRAIFGADGKADPPDLIIQDELHLISGPLGTLVGLYETAVDAAAATAGPRPKLVASTATIRNAAEQVGAVFDRESRQFPPPGTDPADSFFAVLAPPEELPARLYVGLMAPGTSHATLMVRAYAALLQAGKDLDAPDAVRDAYWTLLGYFNSLRVLGAAFIQTIDDVPGRMPVVARRTGSEPRQIGEPKELTSRESSEEVPERLKELASSIGDERCQDVVLATNMISVGVDVDRLGLMVVMGQPQTTSEYIQATSRVGRRRPGLVVTLYNAARTRDLSHYESFVPYHRALYRQVEATGATPFAPRAVDRGLHGVVVALFRLLVPGAGDDAAVGAVRDATAVAKVREIVASRVRTVAPHEEPRVLEAFDSLIDYWADGVDEKRVQKYISWDATPGSLIVPAGGGRFGGEQSQIDQFPVGEPAWPTLTSLRNVDATSTLFQVPRRLHAHD